jgi:protein MpaA
MKSSWPRLGLNQGSYRGERIQIGEVLQQLSVSARRHGWEETLVESAPDRTLAFYHRPAPTLGAANLYISAGIHGDEPASPLAALDLIQRDLLPRELNLWLCPCLNPTGCSATTRENADGLDLNRDYRQLRSPEIQAQVAWLQTLPRLDLTLLLHEDWEASGFYLYELNPHGLPSLAESMVHAVSQFGPLDDSPLIDGRPTVAPGIIRPEFDPTARPEWPEAYWLYQHKGPLSYTLEAPSDYPLALRTQLLTTAVLAACAGLGQTGPAARR